MLSTVGCDIEDGRLTSNGRDECNYKKRDDTNQ